MKKLTLPLALIALALASCQSGPKRLYRNWDNFVNQKYSENSLVHGALLQDILPVYPIVGFVLTIGDILILNPYYFWFKDVWDQNGTAYRYEQPTDAVREVSGWDPRKDDDVTGE